MINLDWLLDSSLLILVGGGIISGILSGFLGISGSIILVPLLVAINCTPIQAVATSSLAIAITAMSGSIQNWRMGHFDLKGAICLGFPALITVPVGLYLATKISSPLLLFLFGVLLLINIYLIQLSERLRGEDSLTSAEQHDPILSGISGGAGGLFAGLFGVGEGVIMVPLQMLLLGEQVKVAIQTSLGVIVAITVFTCAGYAAEGHVLFVEGIILGIGGFLGTQVSTRILPKLPDALVTLTFRIFLGILSIYIFWQAWTLSNAQPFVFWQAWTQVDIQTFFIFSAASVSILVFASLCIFLIKKSPSYFAKHYMEDMKGISMPTESSERFRIPFSKWAIPILLLFIVVPSLNFAWGNRAVISKIFAQSQNSDCFAPDSIVKKSSEYLQVCKAMQDVLNVPDGQFFYGGTMGAAALHSRNFLKEINKAHPEFRLRYLDPLVLPPDSGMGIKMLLNGELSFAESQRPLRDTEYKQAKDRNFNLKQIPVAMTGITFFSHPSLHLPGLSLNQVQDIYVGKVTNWKQVGGPNLLIIPVSQDFDQTGSTFSLLLQGLPPERQRLGQKVKLVRDTTASIRKVATTPGAIGYGTQAIVVKQRTIRPIGLAKWSSRDYIQPATSDRKVNKEVLRNGSYPLISRIFVVVREDGTLDESAGMAYANLLLSQKGQELIDQAGYLPIRSKATEVR